jgi:hypothetical protein
MSENPGYLSNEACPYSPKTVEFLQDLTRRDVVSEIPSFEGDLDKLDYVESEIVRVLTDLTALSANLGTADHSEKLQVAKARAPLVEKLTNLREKVWNMREMSEFQAQILRFLENDCTKDQVQALKERLRGLKSVEAIAQ